MLQNTGIFPVFLFGVVTNLVTCIPWSLIFLFTQTIGIHFYMIKKREECSSIQKKLGACSQITDGGKGSGYSIGYWYIAHVSSSNMDDTCIWLIATKESYEALSKEKEIAISFPFQSEDGKTKNKNQKPFSVVDRYGSNMNPYFRPRNLTLSVRPRPIQQTIIDDIRVLLQKKKSAVILLHGPPNVGKTMVSLIAANEFSGIYCNNLSPWEPGDTIVGIYTDFEISEKNPLILAFDEVDSAIEQIHVGIQPHKDTKIKVRNKAGWNKMFDEIQKGFYPDLVVIMTTNRSPEFFDSLDPSYMASHRVDKIYRIE